jgi:hypothetical protein
MIDPGQVGDPTDFIIKAERNGTPANDFGHVAQLEDDAMIHSVFLRDNMATDASDGDLIISSGTTTINCAGAALVVRNYGDVSITGTANLAFSNPNANGTTIIINCRKLTVTSSANPAINASGMGAAGGTGATTAANATTVPHGAATPAYGLSLYKVLAPTTGSPGGAPSADFTTMLKSLWTGLFPFLVPGSGGAGGSVRTFNNGGVAVTGGNGGRGGGALIINCSGEWDVTSNISVAGAAGGNASGGGTEHMRGGGGGGGGGFFVGIYRRLIANSGSVVKTGGAGGTGAEVGTTGDTGRGGAGGSSTNAVGSAATGTSTRDGGAGSTGLSIVTRNTGLAS